uniref:cysteine dioxygenase n=2 Tax=Oryza sativa subsp. japonica TaxID=39947 RepID=Q7G6I1_ORYSJ|nr:Hypothetical protein [Oryza sativa Japonica Group]AAM08887.1 unknown protein [Oryza sativa Japonica Group]
MAVVYLIAFVVIDWCSRLHGWLVTPPLMGVYVFTDRPPRLLPTGVSGYMAGLLYHCCWASTTSPPACLRRHRLVSLPIRWPIMPPLLGVYDFTASLPPLPPTGVLAYTEWISQNIINRLAFAAADWCFRLYGWLVTPPLLGVYVFATGLPSPPPTSVSACTAGLLCRRCWVATSSPTGCLAAADWYLRLYGWPIMPSLLGVYVFTDRLAFTAADWCLRLHGWPIMPPLLGVYVFTDRLAFAAADWYLRLHGWPIMPPLLGVYVFTDRLAFVAADWCLRLHGWPIMPPLLGVYVFTTGSPSPPSTSVSACMAGLLCRRCRTSTSSPAGRLV